MLIDHIKNASLYFQLSPIIRRAFDYIQQTDLLNTACARYELDGENLFAIVQEYSTKPIEQGRWEAHRRYIDLQYVVRGTERIGYVNLNNLAPGEYNAEKDISFHTGNGDFLTLQPGSFMLLFPEDAHMPGIALDEPAIVKKVVLKIACGG